MIIKKAYYKTSVVDKKNILQDELPEIAFVGRSNVGKSTLINYLLGVKNLAKASATPGKTKMINYFLVNDSFKFVDLPGYGYAKVGKGQLDVWSSLIGAYLTGSRSLSIIFLLLDCRHLPSDQDRQMVEYLLYNKLPFMVVLTKSDKLSRSALDKNIDSISSSLGLRKEIFFVVSAQNKTGREALLDAIEQRIEAKD